MADRISEIPYQAVIDGLKARLSARQKVVHDVEEYLRGLQEELAGDIRFLRQAEENRDRASVFDAAPAILEAALSKPTSKQPDAEETPATPQEKADGQESSRLRGWAVEVLLKQGRPMGLTAIYKEIVRTGYPVRSRDPVQLLKRAMQSDRRIERHGSDYWVAGVKFSRSRRGEDKRARVP